MSQHDRIEEQPGRDDASVDRADDSPDTEAGELSFDDLAMPAPGQREETPFVHELQERAGSALDEPAAGKAPDNDAAPSERWPRPVQFLCIMGGSALCWAVILAPFLLF